MATGFLNKLETAGAMLPKQQRKMCNYVHDNLLEASMLTIPQMAERTGIATATVVRTALSLGYDSYSQFKKDI